MPSAPAETAELVAAARSGDGAAFDQLVAATYEDAYGLARRLTGNDDDARDVLQEAYLRAFRGLRRFRGEARFSTWLHRIVVNCASTHLDRRHRHRHEVLDEGLQLVDERPATSPEDRFEAGALRDRLTVAIDALPPRLRAVVVLRDVYDLPHAAIAGELGISETAAKVRLHRARRRLREALFAVIDEDHARAV